MNLPDVPFRLSQAVDLGVSRAQLRRWVSSGEVVRPFRGVYFRADLPDALVLRAQCARLALPAHAVVCDRSAAWLHGVDCLAPFELEVRPPSLEVVSLGGAASRTRGVYGGERALRPDEVMLLHGVNVTTPVRTAIDLASLRGAAGALAVVEMFMRAHGLARSDLEMQLQRHAGRRGVIQARRVTKAASPLSESPGESWTKWFIIEAGLPMPQQQVELQLDGWGLVRLDLGYPVLKVAVEYDGEADHGPDQEPRDRARREALRRQGWEVIVVRKAGLTATGREEWLDRLESALAERMPTHRRTFPMKQAWSA